MMPTNEMPTLPPRRNKAIAAEKKSRPFLKVFLSLLIAGALCGLGYAAYLFIKFDKMLDHASDGTSDKVQEESSPVKERPMSILLLGLDTRKQTGSLNTDVIMVATLNPQTKSATIVSIPRDTYLKPEGYRARKVNAFYAVSVSEDKEHASDNMKKIIGDYLGISIDYTAIINFKAFEDMVDELGGVEVDVDMDMRYRDRADGTNINLKKGLQTLDGKNALDFVRYRKSNLGTASSSDFERNDRQQRVLAAVVDELKSFGGALKLGGIFDAIGENMTTDIPKSQLKSFIKTYVGISNDHIEYIPLEGEWQSPFTYIKPESLDHAKQSLQQRINKMGDSTME